MIRLGIGALVSVAAILVLVGVGQGSPPPKIAVSAKEQARSIKRVDKGNDRVHEGQKQFTAAGCDSCHTVGASHSSGTLGPRLDAYLKSVPRIGIEDLIKHPAQVKIPGYDNNLMPRDYAQRLSKGEIRAIASYLRAAAGG